jgi:hypothetical protein
LVFSSWEGKIKPSATARELIRLSTAEMSHAIFRVMLHAPGGPGYPPLPVFDVHAPRTESKIGAAWLA